MPKRKSKPQQPAGIQSIQQTITQSVVAWDDVAFSKLLETQKAALGELTAVKTLLELSKEVKKAETPVAEAPTNTRNISPEILALRALKEKQAKQITPTAAAAAPDLDRIQEKMFEIAKEHLKVSRKTLKTQEDFQKEWDVEAKNIAEMAKGMKVFKSFGEKAADKKAALSEKYGIANGGLKKTVLGAMNVGGIFNKTLARDEFVKKQQALGSKASVKELKSDFEGAQTATKAIQKNEKKIQDLKDLTGADEDELKVHHSHLFEERQTQTEQLSKYDRGARLFSPDKKNAKLAGLIPTAGAPVMGKTPTSAAADVGKTAESEEENGRVQKEQEETLKKIEKNTEGLGLISAKKEEKKPEPVKEEGGILNTIMSFLGAGLIASFKAMFNPKNILKFLGKAFAIGAIIGALWEGISDGFDEFMKTGDIGKALIAGLAGIIDFLTFGLFDKEKIKAVIGDMAAWTNEHIVKPVTEFFTSMKDAFMGMLSKIGIPEITLLDNKLTGKVTVGPFYPFKDTAPTPAGKTPEAPTPTSANTVEQKSSDNKAAEIQAGGATTNTTVVNAPVNNNSTTNRMSQPAIRNQESSVSRYIGSRYA